MTTNFSDLARSLCAKYKAWLVFCPYMADDSATVNTDNRIITLPMSARLSITRRHIIMIMHEIGHLCDAQFFDAKIRRDIVVSEVRAWAVAKKLAIRYRLGWTKHDTMLVQECLDSYNIEYFRPSFSRDEEIVMKYCEVEREIAA